MSQDTAVDDSLGETTLLDRIRELILGGDYKPGTALSEVRLAEYYAVSRTPVREALKQLQIEGLVEIRPKVGTFVREITRREILEMFEVKETLEGLAARLMARRGQIPELDTLRTNVEASELAVLRNDSAAYANLVHEFHETLITGSDNLKLAQHYRTLMNQLAYHHLVLTSVQHPGRLSRSTAEHRQVLELITAKDSVGAELAMKDHVWASSREVMMDSVSRQDRN
ncbi:GntR family transcriptional regulator [Arthrobacter sp. STN4]|uniref:GntR family transcriptional regulator n=1 Tax=Arthrobacter sp. STN4 TaxID=2923276 RepID=UPI00211A561F|nr:GntR family transcriptional regulator [Arthrobacter sp. STN4]MCQ9164534.1 GntR family transcriptional regulator [Arthrobacter sp. STN4]